MSGVRVLVVDDERKIRDLVGSYLERQGYLVTLAATGGAALDAGVREHPDPIGLDVRLPDIPGEEVARSIREVSPVPRQQGQLRPGQRHRTCRAAAPCSA